MASLRSMLKTFLYATVVSAGAAGAAISPQDAARLGADLTPLGAESRVTRTAMGPTASVYPSLARGPEGDVGVLFRDQREGRIQAWFTRLQCASPR